MGHTFVMKLVGSILVWIQQSSSIRFNVHRSNNYPVSDAMKPPTPICLIHAATKVAARSFLTLTFSMVIP